MSPPAGFWMENESYFYKNVTPARPAGGLSGLLIGLRLIFNDIIKI